MRCLMKRILTLALMLLPLAAASQSRSYYTDFMYDNYVGDVGRHPTMVPGSMEYAIPRGDARRPPLQEDTVGYVDMLIGISRLGGYNVQPGSHSLIGGLEMDGKTSLGWGFRIGFDMIDQFVGIEVDFEGSSQDGAEPGGRQSSFNPMLCAKTGGDTYRNEAGEEETTESLPATPVLQNYKQDVKFFQGGLNLVFNFGGSHGLVNPFFGVGGGIARMSLQNRGSVNTHESEMIDNWGCLDSNGEPIPGIGGMDCDIGGIWNPGYYDDSDPDPSNHDWVDRGCEDAQGNRIAGRDEHNCSDPMGDWMPFEQVESWSESTAGFPFREGVSVGYARAIAGIAVRVGPYANVIASASYTRYNDPGFSTMTLESLERTTGSVGIRLNF